MSSGDLSSKIFDACYEMAGGVVTRTIEGATTIQEAAALLDCSVLFHPPREGRNGVFGIGLDGVPTLKIDPNMREKEQWDHLRHGLALVLMWRDKPEWFVDQI